KIYSEQEALDIIIQVAQALEHAHAVGLIHRDVKPKNIMITKDGVVKLADMGLARETADIETAKLEAGKAYGTPYYIAPEQIKGMVDVDGRADIYSLGATFYHMLTGRVPFTGEDSAEIMRKHLKEPLIPPDHINTSLSAGVSEIIEVMMAKRREDRYANAKELLADLIAVRNGQPPLRAKRRFDVSAIEKLEQGTPVDEQEEVVALAESLRLYRTATIALGAVCALLLMVVVFLLAR
ncbi:MAG: serine/threonine-protein kinase, partial [Sedimentisphaerales bacterium]|nr:serine/threonine-protein kinase [Sedimentisphaerales bacterium]